jgi:hypothetical protein
MADEIIVKINNFKLVVFKSLIEQSLIVGDELILEFSPKLIRSITYTGTKSFMKLWIINMKDLVQTKEELKIPNIIDLSNDVETSDKVVEDFPVFDFYILKGSLIRKFFKVHTTDVVDIQFSLVLNQVSNKYQARNFVIISESQAFSVSSEKKMNLKTTFPLSTEELMTNKIDDYKKVIDKCQPSKEMYEFVLDKTQIQEIKRLIKNLHKISSQNKVYLNFNVDVINKKIVITDSIFSYDIDLPEGFKYPEKSFNFNILKSDFIITGNHTFTIYACENDPRIIMGASFMKSILWGMVTKISDPESINTLSEAVLDSTLENLTEYFNPDDLPF